MPTVARSLLFYPIETSPFLSNQNLARLTAETERVNRSRKLNECFKVFLIA